MASLLHFNAKFEMVHDSQLPTGSDDSRVTMVEFTITISAMTVRTKEHHKEKFA